MGLAPSPRAAGRRQSALALALAALLGAVHAQPAAAPGVQDWPLPATSAAAQPSLASDSTGIVLSWVEPTANGHRLRIARHAHGAFEAATTVAEGSGWFVNAADFPNVVALADGRLATFILQRTADAPYAYAILRSEAPQLEGPWSTPAVLHDDGTDTEHGFVAMWAWGDDLGIAWLDGRHTATPGASGGHGGGHAGAHGGAMSLRAARLRADGEREEWALDERTCDCCQTDAAVTARGPVVAYRDRDEDEVRDIVLARHAGGAWHSTLVHRDEWVTPACPVNGPAVAASGMVVLVAWYTEAEGQPQLRLASSRDAGASFAPPVVIERGAHLLGRVDLLIGFDAAWLSWMQEDAQGQQLKLVRIALDAESTAVQVETPFSVASMPRGRSAGFPRMALDQGTIHLVWTQPVDGSPRIRGATVRP